MVFMAEAKRVCFSLSETFFSEHNFKMEVLKPNPAIITPTDESSVPVDKIEEQEKNEETKETEETEDPAVTETQETTPILIPTYPLDLDWDFTKIFTQPGLNFYDPNQIQIVK